MRRLLFLSFFVLLLPALISAQTHADSTFVPVADSSKAPGTAIAARDSLPLPAEDSVCKKPWEHTHWALDPAVPLSIQLIRHHPYFGFGSNPVVIHTELKPFHGKEMLFYIFIALLLTLAFMKQAFPKYFNDLFRLFFRTTLKQRQIREQLIQTPLPSLFLNTFFVVSGGLYIDILLHHFGILPVENFWLLFLYCSLGLSVIYAVKFVGLKISGWLFNMKEAADSYIFVVFVINKVLGIFLLPFSILLSFIQGDAYTVSLVLSWCGVGVLLIYRFILTYASVRNQVRLNPFHFFLYFCAFEIAPLLLIYKALLFFFR
ncbi:MAG: DUF4271 domain-containing protein [Bacteroidota bacterium]|nr:DUF4271 domain-containing protein [Bacteroidota bacterium]